MTTHEFFRNTATLVVVMALLAVLETVVPFFRSDWRRRHASSNLRLTAVTLGLNLAFNAGSVLLAAWLGARGFGVFAHTALPGWLWAAIGIVVLDASTYVCHRSMHVIAPLWRVHAVHHSDPLVDVTTALRFHPLETSWRFLFIAGPASVLALPAGAVAAYRMVSVFFAIYEHMNVKLWQPLDTALSLVVGTPNMHKLHHSRLPAETDTNYGNILSLFDRLLGTFTPTSRAAKVSYGLTGLDEARAQTFRALVRMPFTPARPKP
jgi:sterol desaturase/sphingolipid hydroxylase (fatty acid hydroxylase superfamily)